VSVPPWGSIWITVRWRWGSWSSFPVFCFQNILATRCDSGRMLLLSFSWSGLWSGPFSVLAAAGPIPRFWPASTPWLCHGFKKLHHLWENTCFRKRFVQKFLNFTIISNNREISVILKEDSIPSGAQTTLQSIINKHDTFIFVCVWTVSNSGWLCEHPKILHTGLNS